MHYIFRVQFIVKIVNNTICIAKIVYNAIFPKRLLWYQEIKSERPQISIHMSYNIL